MLSCLSYNIEFGKRLDDIRVWLQSHDKKFNLLCLQEFPQSKISLMVQTFPQYDYKFCGDFIKKDETYGQLTLFDREKLECLQSQEVYLGDSFIESILHKTKVSKIALVTVFMRRGKKFILVNTHLACLALNVKRRMQLEKIITAINASEAAKPLPALVVGDFNYSSLFLRQALFKFMDQYNFKNTFVAKTHRLGLVNQQLDYIFCRDCVVDSAQVLSLSFSDHYPIEFAYTV